VKFVLVRLFPYSLVEIFHWFERRSLTISGTVQERWRSRRKKKYIMRDGGLSRSLKHRLKCGKIAVQVNSGTDLEVAQLSELLATVVQAT
jgi:hypothetical protein